MQAAGPLPRRCFQPLLLFAAALSAILLAHAGQKQEPTPTLRVASHLVTVNAIVEDKNGNPVSDLRQDKFEILDGGQAQRISFFSKYTDQPPATAQPLPPNTYTNVIAHQGTTPPSVVIILFDTLNSRKTSQGWGMEAIRKFLRQIQPGQHVGIYVLGDELKVVHDFTRDDSDLVHGLAEYDEAHTAKGSDDKKSGGASSELDRFLDGKDIRRRPEIDGHMRGIERQSMLQDDYFKSLAVLQAMARHLVGVPGRKSLIWVSDAVPSVLLSDDLESYEEATAHWLGSPDEFIRGDIENLVRLMSQNGIAVYPVSSAGLEAMDLNFHFTDGLAGGVPSTANILQTPPLDEHVDMVELAKRTGGRAFYNRNDIETGIERAVNDEKFSYTLGYYPDLKKWDGKWRKIQVKVNRPGVTVLARDGYFALPDSSPRKPKDHKAETEFLGQIAASPVDAVQFPVYVQLAAPAGKGRLDAHVYFNPRSELRSDGKGRWTGNFQIEFMQLDGTNHVLDATDKSLDVNLLDSDYPRVAQHGLDLPATLEFKPRAAQLCVIVRDLNSDDVGSVHVPLAGYRSAPSGN